MRVIEEEVGAEVMLLTARVEEVEGVRLVVSVLIIGSLLGVWVLRILVLAQSLILGTRNKIPNSFF